MNAKELRRKLLDLLSEEVGEYKNSVPSIWVYGSGSNPPSRSNGLEVLLESYPKGDPQSTSGGVRYYPQFWEVTLKNWQQTNKLVRGLNKIQANFITRRMRHYPANEQTIERAMLEIFDPVVLPPRDIIPDSRLPEVTDDTEWFY